MTRPLHILLGGSDQRNGDYSELQRLAATDGTAEWSGVKTAMRGDRVLIYVGKPEFAVVAVATVQGRPRKGGPGDFPYRVPLGRFRWLHRPLTRRDLQRAFPRWPWIRHTRGKTTVPAAMASRLWKMAKEGMNRPEPSLAGQIFLCSESDCERFGDSEADHRIRCLKGTVRGDQVWLYCYAPVSAIVGIAEVLGSARPAGWRLYETKIGRVRWLRSPTDLDRLRAEFPLWKWLKSCQTPCALDARKSARMRELAGDLVKGSRQPRLRSRSGAGFGSPEANKQVELAAIRRVTRDLRREGYQVRSREQDGVGYDLEATKGRKQLHVEVKGIAGDALQFAITAGELQQARKDAAFELRAVTQARTQQAKVHRFPGKAFLKQFHLEAMAYRATRRGKP